MFTEVKRVGGSQTKLDPAASDEREESYKEVGTGKDADSADEHTAEAIPEVDLSTLTGRQKKLFELRLKMVSMC